MYAKLTFKVLHGGGALRVERRLVSASITVEDEATTMIWLAALADTTKAWRRPEKAF